MPNIVDIVLIRNSVLVRKNGSMRHLMNSDDLAGIQLFPETDSLSQFKIGEYDGFSIRVHVYSSKKEIVYNNDYELIPSKPYMDTIDSSEHPAMLRALHLNNWHSNTKYCGKCGHETQLAHDEAFAKSCLEGHKIFLSYSPAVLVMVIRTTESGEEQILLVRNPRFPQGLYTHIAGFVDPGESFEDAVIREVKEEAGVSVTNIRYFGDQSWPFPSGHMIAFKADYLGGKILITDTNEIEDARWFSREEVRKIQNPPGTNFSISNTLTQSFLSPAPQKRHFSTALSKTNMPENLVGGMTGFGLTYPLLRYSVMKESGALISPSIRPLLHRWPPLVSMHAMLFALGCSALNSINTRSVNPVYDIEFYRSLERYWPLAFGVMASAACTPLENSAFQKKSTFQLSPSDIKRSFSSVGVGVLAYTVVGFSIFKCYPGLKKELEEKFESPKPLFPIKAVAGLGSGFAMSMATQPFHVLRARQQKRAATFRRSSIPEIAKTVYAKHGVKGFYKGILPRTIWFAAAVAVADHIKEEVAPVINTFFKPS